MRKTAVTLLIPLALLLGACNSGSGSADSTQDTQKTVRDTAPANTITGSVSVQPGTASTQGVSANAKLELTLEDISQRPSVPVARKTIDSIGQLPIDFSLEFNPDRIVPDDIFVIVAKITDGERNFTMPLQKQVLTKGKPRQVQITLVPEPTPGEKMMTEFREMQGQLGGMKISKGTSLGEHGSRAWQIFAKNNHVEFVVDIEEDFDTNARVRGDYAYRSGKPWVVVLKHMPKAGADPDSIKRAGWDKTGKLVLKEHEANGKTEKLSEDDARALHEKAEAEFKKAGNK